MNAKFGGAVAWQTIFGDLDLSGASGLQSIQHRGPSVLDIATLYRSQGRLAEEYGQSLFGKPVQFYSCFISYSSEDQQFADLLYGDLQANGVRCWFAPEDLKIGDIFRQRIYESIRLHDKLLLILVEHSVNSHWVQDEMEAAQERERRENRLVLFPIRIDNAIMNTDKAWAASIRRTRHIGDFFNWKDNDGYQWAFQRLLRDLKAEECEPE